MRYRTIFQRTLIVGAAFTIVAGGVAFTHAQAEGTVVDTWTIRSVAIGPAARAETAMVYDAARGETVLFGGHSDGPIFGDTWIWDGTTWTQRFPTTSPPARYGAATAYDAARGEVVLFGGFGGGYRNDTWIWDGVTWTQRFPATSPSVRYEAAMAYDVARGEIVLFGGSAALGGTFGDTWIWDGTTWTQRFPATSPSVRHAGAMAYDASRSETVIFSGFGDIGSVGGDTWIWDGTTWTQRFPTTSPPARGHAAMAYDASRGEPVLFGGTSFDDTWTWSGTTWIQRSPIISPSDRSGSKMAYDIVNNQAVLFGGIAGDLSRNSDTWTYDWIPLSAPTLPPSWPPTPTVSPSVGSTTGYPSDDCAAGATIEDGFAGSAYLRIRTATADARTTWVCVRADGPSINYGGKFAITDPAATLPALPTTDIASSACTAAPDNAIPGQHPIQSGSVGDPADPTTYLPFLVDAHATTSQAWVCVGVGTVQRRIVVPASAGAAPPTVVFTPDLPGPHTPPAQTTATPSGACQSGGGETGRLVNTTVADAKAWLYTWQPAASILKLCVRAEGAASAGGVLTLDTTAAAGALPAVTTSTTDLAPCTLSVVKVDNPGIEVRRSADTAPASICINIGTSALRVTATTGTGQPPATVTWTPDPGTP